MYTRVHSCRPAVLIPALLLGVAVGQARAADTELIRGRLVRVDADARTVTVKTVPDREVVLTVTDQSRLTGADGKPVTLPQLRAGQKVRVTYVQQDGTNRLVSLKPTYPTDKDLAREVREAFTAVKQYSHRQKEKYDDEVREAVHKVDDRLDDLRERAEAASGEAKARLQERIEVLKQKRDELAKRLDKARPAAEDAWEEVKSGVAAAAEDLERALDKLR